MSRLKTAALVTIVAAAALVPLFGDPRATPVTHPIWARMLLRALELDEAVRVSTHASDVFSALSWRDSLTYPADHYARADGVGVPQRGERCLVAAGEAAGQVVYPLAVVRGGDYQVRLRMAGDPSRPATAEIVPAGAAAALKTLTFVPPPSAAWVRGGSAHLDPGAYTATVLLPQGSSLEYVEVAPPCLNPIEPVAGWKPAAITTVDDVAVTALKAMDTENELPPASVPLERTGADFQVEAMVIPAATRSFEALVLKAGRDGLRAVLFVDLPEAGLYTVSVYGLAGSGQRWLADGCRKAVLCPSDGALWRVVMSQPFAAGRHTFAVALTEGAVVERLRLERKKERVADYLGTLRRLGFDPGPEGPVSRDKAVGAMRFIQDRRALGARLCGDVVLREPAASSFAPQQAEASAPEAPRAVAAPAVAPKTTRLPRSPIDLAILPPQLVASPVAPLLPAVAAAPGS